MKRLVLALLICFLPFHEVAAAQTPLPRVLLGLYDGRKDASPRSSQIHRFLEMPANFLGYDIHYHDIGKPLPALGPDIAGVVLWFDSGTAVPDADAYVRWLETVTKAGRKLIVIEDEGLGEEDRKNPLLIQRWNRVLAHIGLRDSNDWNGITYAARILNIDEEMVGFERKIGPMLPPFAGIHAVGGDTISHLRIAIRTVGEDENYDLVTTSPRGGYIAQGYALYHLEQPDGRNNSQWFVNPFLFLRKALSVELMPIPDPTTLAGRRIFYSHIDGDGWNNISTAAKYDKKHILSAEVIYHEILKPYRDFAFNVGLIAADVELDCYGLPDSERIAREVFALPNVEPSSHTYSHPLFWKYFDRYSPEEEKKLLSRYAPKPKQKISLVKTIEHGLKADGWDAASFGEGALAPEGKALGSRKEAESIEEELNRYFRVPRSYACEPFDLTKEVEGAMQKVNELSPKDKKATLLQWSGDTSPFEAALAEVRRAGFLNINGGDSRFDEEYPSYSSVAPVGLQVGSERQIYSSNSNENTYTNLWTGRFFGFRYLQNTVRNTESPIRVRPFNLYFHIYSGEKEASLNAIKENLEFARTQDIIPITTQHYAAIANGFYAARVEKAGELSWRIRNQGALQTFRFDQAEGLSVDFLQSKGVIGQRYFQHSLYTTLDPEAEEAYIVLKKHQEEGAPPREPIPYLVESSWEIKNLQNSKNRLTFDAHGYGKGRMAWHMPAQGEYEIRVEKSSARNTPLLVEKRTTDDDGRLSVQLDETLAMEALTLHISPAAE